MMPCAIELSVPHILLVDDHALIRGAVREIIREALPAAQFGEATTTAAAVAEVEREPWHLVVLDLGLPGSSEMDLLRQLRALRRDMPILVFSMFPEEKMGVAAMRAGATGYLCKTADHAMVARAVNETLAGRGYISERLRGGLAHQAAKKFGSPSALSSREREVLLALGRGLSNKEIAAHLGLGASSVGTYRTRIMEKLSLRTTADLLRYVVEHRLVQD